MDKYRESSENFSLLFKKIERLNRIIKIHIKNIFYTRHAFGKDWKRRKIIKFRTYKKGQNKRLRYAPFIDTLKINEIPNLINLVTWDMSLFGYRPLEIYEYKELNKTLQEWLNKYKPWIIPLITLAYPNIDHKDIEGKEILIMKYLHDLKEKWYARTHLDYMKTIITTIFNIKKEINPTLAPPTDL